MSKVLITGGAGFIGSQLGWKLHREGYDVLLLDNMSFGNEDNLIFENRKFPNFVKEDIRSKNFSKYLKNVDYVFHLAGISSLPVCQENPMLAIDVNVSGTANVLELSRRNNVKRIIFSSTSAVYENNQEFPSTEIQEVSPSLIYAVTKYQSELLCKSFITNYGMEIVIARYFNVYGPHQDFKRKSPPMTGYILKELLANRSPQLFSDGTQRRDYVYVDDVNDLNTKCMTSPVAPGEIFNVASGKSYSVIQVYTELAKALGSSLKPTFASSANYWNKYPMLYKSKFPFSNNQLDREVRKFTQGSSAKAAELMAWKPNVSLADGMKKLAKFALDEYRRTD